MAYDELLDALVYHDGQTEGIPFHPERCAFLTRPFVGPRVQCTYLGKIRRGKHMFCTAHARAVDNAIAKAKEKR